MAPNLLDPLDLIEPKDLSQFKMLLLTHITAELFLALFFLESNLTAAVFLTEFLPFSIDHDLNYGWRLSPVIWLLICSLLMRHIAIRF